MQKSNALSFRQFIELKENLHRYWANANLAQKEKIVEAILLNLEVKDQKIRSTTWVEPVANWQKPTGKGGGGAYYPDIELHFEHLWKTVFSSEECRISTIYQCSFSFILETEVSEKPNQE